MRRLTVLVSLSLCVAFATPAAAVANRGSDPSTDGLLDEATTATATYYTGSYEPAPKVLSEEAVLDRVAPGAGPASTDNALAEASAAQEDIDSPEEPLAGMDATPQAAETYVDAQAGPPALGLQAPLPARLAGNAARGAGLPSDEVRVLLKYNRLGGPGWATLREGYWVPPKGCCWQKVTRYHNLTDVRALDFITSTPRWAPSGGLSWKGTAYAQIIVCDTKGCNVVQEMQIFPLVDERKLDDGRSKGLFNAYCDSSVPRCPDWVTTSLVTAFYNTR